MDPARISMEGRKGVALLALAAMTLFLITGLFKLQIFEHTELARQSENNRIRVEPIVPKRGVVVDRDGQVIIDNRPSYAVSIVPFESQDSITIPRLSELLNLDTLEIRRRIRKNFVSRYQPAMIKRDINFEIVAVLEEQADRYPGVAYSMERVRIYTPGLGSEAFTGYVGEVSEVEIERSGSDEYRLGSMVGKKGIERLYDRELRGTEGTRFREVSATGQRLGIYEEKQAVRERSGSDLTLTIDADLQRAAVQALDTFCCGAVVAINPRTGGVLAITSYPGYDANIFSSVIPESLWTAISSDSTHPLLNRPISGSYPPASTAKLVTIGAALEEGIIGRNTTLKPCLGGLQYGNRYFRCWNPAGHGNVNAVQSLEVSCDVYLYQVGQSLGIDLLSHYYGLCGFGTVTGIDIPGEIKGLNPNSEWYDKNYGPRKWSKGLVLNNAIGQGEVLSTPLQLAQFFCGVANNGVVFRPHLLHKTTRWDGTETEVEPEVAFTLPFSQQTLKALMDGLRAVVEGPNGTAKSLANNRYTVGGKTGTAENPHGENHSWFVGVAPLDNPEIVVCAILENAGHGSEVAAPLVGQLLDKYFEKRHGLTPPSDSNSETQEAGL